MYIMVTPNSKNNFNQRVELDLDLNPKYSEDFKTVKETEDFSEFDLITDKTTKKKLQEGENLSSNSDFSHYSLLQS